MSIESATDREEYLEEFGKDAVVKVGDRIKKPITVIFDNEYHEIGEVEASEPMATAHAVDVEDIAQDATIEISDIIYRIINVKPDGEGFAVLTLSRESN